MTEIQVAAIDPAAKPSGRPPVRWGNAAEHSTAIFAALKNRMDLSLPIGSARDRVGLSLRPCRGFLALDDCATDSGTPTAEAPPNLQGRVLVAFAECLKWVTGGKTPSEYMFSELPQLADIAQRVLLTAAFLAPWRKCLNRVCC